MPTTKTHFSKDFLWGVSVSAHQVEGGNHNQWSVWELENARAKAAQGQYHYDDLPIYDDIKDAVNDPHNYISNEAVDHYHRYKEDFALARKLNMNTFRFSVEWSRIEPKEGVWDPKEIEHYKQYIKAMKAAGLEPVMTLFHFTLPVWFAEKGGFLKRGNIKDFVRFCDKVIEELGREVTYVITMNEIGVYAGSSYGVGHWPPNKQSVIKTWRVIHNLMAAHRRVSKSIHRTNPSMKVSFATNMSNIYAGDDALLTRIASRLIGYYRNDYVLQRMYKHCDFIGLNYYFADQVFGYRIHNSNRRVSDLGWDMKPDHIQHVIEHISYMTKLPVMITENGVADQHDQYRQWWLQGTMRGMMRAMRSGAVIIGYVHWSLLDNFEWAQGKWPRFGLVAVDYKTQKRTVRPSAVWWAGVIKKLQDSKPLSK